MTSPISIDPTRSPVVQITDTNEAMADSRDVAAYFGKNHFDVLRAVRNLQCSVDFRERNFASFKINDLTGETTSHVMMTKDGFTFLVMGFTGGRAAMFKERYIAQFNMMESQLRKREPSFNLPTTFAEALRLAADQSERIAKQEAEIATLAPKAEGYDRFLNAEGLIGLQDAGRALLCHPNLFIQTVIVPKYCFRDGGRIVARQEYVVQKLFENKPFTAPNGKVFLRAWMTPKGVEHFSTRIPDSVRSWRPSGRAA